MDFKNKKILVIGGGKSGIASINLLQELGADVDFLDGNLQFNIPELLGKINKPDELGFHLGELPDELIGDYDLGVVSPGVPLDVPMIKNLGWIWNTIQHWIICPFQFNFKKMDIFPVKSLDIILAHIVLIKKIYLLN